ncbi:Tetratricopeptide TPR_2 repeat protein [Leptothrix cholodnii SP-6]|uniref:Tetratricopeptide TPR_2 repeat protein n=1 Tax=Leptothrix cholodnii (strain ATCC 51168 / LMG 8142 / SP-6) TaxID=395495 RepID=B1XXZ3_LEPCP|nr:Tetratricopeptide TPR_2 repeat protein [Leptothrix cholodnii SP-6]
MGDWLLQAGRHDEAESAYRKALQIKPLHARAQEGLGLVLLRIGRLEEAFLHLEAAHKVEPDNAEILTHWGLVDLEMGNLGNAAGKFHRAIERDPRNPHAWHNLGLVALKQGQVDTSIELLRKAIEIRPQHGLAYSNLAMALRRAERLDDALDAARKATEYKADNARVWVVLADVQMNLGDFDAAGQSLERATAIDPQHVGTFVGLGKRHAATGDPTRSREAYTRALQLNPDSADARGGLGELELLLGQWSTAWDLYEARRRVEGTPVRPYPFKPWQGEDLQQRHILVHAEQGLGDIILFASCLPQLQALGGQCTIEVRSRMQALFARSFPQARVIGRAANAELLDWPAELPAFDYEIPFGSLPRWFRARATDFPAHQGYLVADAARVQTWRDKLAPGGRPTVGIAWRGGMAATSKLQRSLELKALVSALAPTGVQLVCLQYGNVDAELEQVRSELGVHIDPGVSGFGDLDDLAALTQACDRIVTVCSTQAHLTGALGKPGLVLVPSNPSWRYLHTGTSMPWYPSLQLVRQQQPGDWSAVLTQAQSWVTSQTAASHSIADAPSGDAL